MTKVSVVVATYQPGEGLDRVIDSLDRQTLPQDEFESIFVDDGSPDDTLARLRELAATRPNMRVESIPNSGWPSRPRNVGIELARGEYVTFMDHDDRLFPDALAKAYAYAVEQRADVVNPKETETRGFFWGWDHYLQDLPADGQKDPTLAHADAPPQALPSRAAAEARHPFPGGCPRHLRGHLLQPRGLREGRPDRRTGIVPVLPVGPHRGEQLVLVRQGRGRGVGGLRADLRVHRVR